MESVLNDTAAASSLTVPGPQKLYLVLFVVLIAFGIYRRFRRNFGPQAVRPVVMSIRIGLLAVVGLALLPLWLSSWGFAAAAAFGVVAGVLLAIFAAVRTRFSRRASDLYYIPHTHSGLIVFSLFMGRLVYRVVEMYLGDELNGVPRPRFMVTSPLTLGLLYVLITYYVVYLSRVLWRSRHLQPDDCALEDDSGQPFKSLTKLWARKRRAAALPGSTPDPKP